MIALFRLVHLAYWRRHPIQTFLPCLGIAIGVGAVVAIDLGSRSTVSSFRRTMEQLEGRATHQILPGAGALDGRLAWQLKERPDVAAAAPVLELVALAQEPLRIYGIDPFAEAGIRQLGLDDLRGSSDSEFLPRFLAEPGALVVSARFLRRQGLQVGDEFSLAVGALRRSAFVLAELPEKAGNLEIPDNLALTDLATAQELAGRSDVSRIDLILRPDADLDAIRVLLPEGAALSVPGGRTARLSTMLAALNANLRALSYLALFVSLFLIYNALLLAVLRRRPQLGVTRCLGATRRQVAGAWLIEASAMGLVGSALGCALGLAASRLTLHRLATTASDLYGYVQADTVEVVPEVFAKASIVGLVATVLAALWPAFEAMRTPPAQTAHRGAVELAFERHRAKAPWLALPFVAMLAASLGLSSPSPTWGYVAAVALALTAAVLAPPMAALLLDAGGSGAGRWFGQVFALANRNLRTSMSRTGVALAALTVALSMSIAMGALVSSFRGELTQWIDQAVRADIYLTPAAARADRLSATLPEEMITELLARSSVVALDSYRGLPARIGNFDTVVAGIETDVYQTRSLPMVIEGPRPAVLLERLRAGEVSLAETLMRRHDLHPGDTFDLTVEGISTEFSIAGVHRDYSSDRGVILMDRAPFERRFGTRQCNSIALYLRAGVDIDAEVEALQRDFAAAYALMIRSNRSLRDQALMVFERTFSVADVLERIGIAVAAVGILSALLAMMLERRRELATLRALGMTVRQLRAMLWIESTLMAALSWFFAVGAGTGLAWILLRVINVRSFGWSLPMGVPWEAWLVNLGWSLLAATLAGLGPMWQSEKLPLALALREE
jgi:putative ABC transport system permease protein